MKSPRVRNAFLFLSINCVYYKFRINIIKRLSFVNKGLSENLEAVSHSVCQKSIVLLIIYKDDGNSILIICLLIRSLQ